MLNALVYFNHRLFLFCLETHMQAALQMICSSWVVDIPFQNHVSLFRLIFFFWFICKIIMLKKRYNLNFQYYFQCSNQKTTAFKNFEKKKMNLYFSSAIQYCSLIFWFAKIIINEFNVSLNACNLLNYKKFFIFQPLFFF